MIKCHLSRIMGEKRLKISDVARDTNLNRGTLTRLYHETAERIELEVLDALCRYFNCKIEDLIEYLPEAQTGQDHAE
ncbi:helix-turn-helix domain-containing protein [Chitinilyticum litopenaei]|uniref:helix-turn-helix domain-containing protein n=1 Tax=Chitinilyticum litopenaei TaxID=1121276 RepID=UPI0005BC2152|nr:helix-turn-helix transcriptional regulator [Chitinilyticum litopenaei]